MSETNRLWWGCKCGWYGHVEEIDKDSVCPKCGSFDNVKIMTYPIPNKLYTVIVTEVMP